MNTQKSNKKWEKKSSTYLGNFYPELLFVAQEQIVHPWFVLSDVHIGEWNLWKKVERI